MDDGGRALLDRVLETPDADEPRLVYADWLIQRGDPRGELISVQIHLLGKLSPSARTELRAKERQLLAEHAGLWGEPLASIARQYAFVRGFVDRVKADDALLEHHGPLFAREPIRSLELRCSGPDTVEKLIATDIIARLASLALRGPIGDDGVRVLASSRQLATLRNLNLGNNAISSEGADAFAASPHLGELRTLTLSGNAIGSDGLAALAGCESLERLEALFIARNEIDDEGLIALARSRAMSTLVKLGLEGNEEIGDDGVLALLQMKQLEHVELGDIGVSNETREKLAKRWS